MTDRTSSARPFQRMLRTTADPEEVLDGIAALQVPGTDVGERGSTYLLLGPRRSNPYSTGRAVVVAVAVVLAVLVGAAYNVVVIALLPLAVVPLVPLLFDDHPVLAVGAVRDDRDGLTQVTVHGMARAELADAVAARLATLPTVTATGERGASPPAAGSPRAGAAAAEAPAVGAPASAAAGTGVPGAAAPAPGAPSAGGPVAGPPGTSDTAGPVTAPPAPGSAGGPPAPGPNAEAGPGRRGDVAGDEPVLRATATRRGDGDASLREAGAGAGG